MDLRQSKSVGVATVRVFYPRSLKFKDGLRPALPSNPTSQMLSFDHWGPLWAVSGSSLGPIPVFDATTYGTCETWLAGITLSDIIGP